MAKTQQKKPAPKATKVRPVTELRDRGIKAAIWRNEGKDNRAFHTVTFSRSYRDTQGEYRDGDSFTGARLLQLADLARRAYHDASELDREAFLQDAASSAPPSTSGQDDEIPF